MSISASQIISSRISNARSIFSLNKIAVSFSIYSSYVLGEEVQSLNQGSGFPINKTAFDASTVDQSNGEIIMSLVNSDMFTGEMVELNIYWPEVSAFDRLKEQIESLDTSMLTDDIIWSAVKEQAVKCLEGESSVDDAVNTLIQKVNLYLAE